MALYHASCMQKEPQRHTAGGVTAEALVLLPILTLIFGLLLYMGYRYQAEIDLNRSARAQLWSQALPGCSSGTLDSERLARVGAVSAQLPVVAPSIRTWLMTLFWQGIDIEAESEIKRPVSLGQGDKRLTSTMHVSCNEVVRPTESHLRSILREAFCMVGVC